MKKRALAFFLCIALCGTLFSPCIPTARAAESIANGTCGENLTWALDSDGVLTISGTGAMEEYPYAEWGTYCSQITSVSLPDGLTSIGGWAFYGCTGLTSITIPSSVTSIGSCAFAGCTGLTSITIPSSVTSIGQDVFEGCSSLIGIWVDADNTAYCNDENGVLLNKEKTNLICCPGGFSGAYIIPASVTSIGKYAFRDCTGLTSITIPSSVTSIDDSTFSGCTGLTSITIPSSVTSIGKYAFRDCTGLTSVTIPSSVTSIGNSAFCDCTGLTSITIPSSVTSIDDYTFSGCTSLTSVTIPSSVTSIGWEAFGGCTSLTSITIPSSVTSIESWAFAGCTGLTSITIPSSVTSIDSWAFSVCSSLTSVSFSEGLTSIGRSAFYGCSSLTSVTIPSSIASIGQDAFKGCSNLIGIWVDADNTAYCNDENGVLLNKEKTNLICCPGGFSGAYIIPASVTSIGWDAFYGCAGLTSISIPESVTSIGWGAFCGCAGLTSISIPESVTSIEPWAFSDCVGLTSITIPSSVTSIDDSTFSGCTGLTSISIPESVTSIGMEAFAGCTGLTSIIIPSSVTSIEWRAFYGCTGLTSIIFPETLTEIGYDAFGNCTALTGAYFYGDAPQLDNAFFYYDEKTSTTAKIPGLTLYYMPGRSGWTSPTYGEQAYPTALWCGEISCPGAQFTDQPDASNWAHKGLDFCIAHGLLSGTSDTTVSPNVTMNRAMLVTVLYSLEGKPEVTAENPFTDVENDRWFSKPVIWAAANGIVSGAGNGKFNPFGNVTREQIAVMLRSYARYKAFDTSASVELSNYPDAGSTSSWAKDALSWAVAEGLISGAASGGATYLNPKNNATRAQVATILMQFVTKVAEN